MENLNNGIEKFSMYKYTITYGDGTKDVLENFDMPLHFQQEDMSRKAIICCERAEELKAFLTASALTHFPVEREMLNEDFVGTGEMSRGFFVGNVSESEAEQIAIRFEATLIIFSMDPDLLVEIVECPINSKSVRRVMFRFED